MKINVNAPLKTPDGSPVWLNPPQFDKAGTLVKDGEPMHLHDVLIQVALQPSPQGKTYEPRQHVIRYALALDTWKAKENGGSGTINISRKVVQEVEGDLCRIFAPIVGGQALVLMGYTLEDLAELFGEDMADELRSMIGGS